MPEDQALLVDLFDKAHDDLENGRYEDAWRRISGALVAEITIQRTLETPQATIKHPQMKGRWELKFSPYKIIMDMVTELIQTIQKQ